VHIVCPHCTTSYAINAAALGEAGRTMRCGRCKELWLARPEDAIEAFAAERVMAETSQSGGFQDPGAEWDALGRDEAEQDDAPLVDSPSIAGDWSAPSSSERDWEADDEEEAPSSRRAQHRGWFRNLLRPSSRLGQAGNSFVSLPTACAAMGALAVALMIWRADVVRLLPQTASFYKMVGLDVNLRGLLFKDVKITTENVEGKPVLVIEGVIVGQTRHTVELPRLRFSVRDGQGAEIYAWNTVLEQPVLKPGERAAFKARLASPPPEGRNIDIRFFNRRDVAGGSA
jgi:predicted Zn finger-like uncharacterized protein